MTSAELVDLILRAAVKAGPPGRVTIRMHPEDMRDIRAQVVDVPRDEPLDESVLWGYPVTADESVPRGESRVEVRVP